MRGQGQRDRVEARLEFAVVQILKLQRIGEHHVISLQPIRPVNQLPRVVLEQLPEQLPPTGLAGGKLHNPYPEDDHRRSVVNDHLSIIWGTGKPEVWLDLRDRQAPAVEP